MRSERDSPRNITIVVPGDPEKPHYGDVELAMNLARIFSKSRVTYPLILRGHTSFMGGLRLFLRLPKWMVGYVSSILFTNNILIVVNNSKIALFTILAKPFILKKARVVYFFASSPLISARNYKGLRRFAHILVNSIVLRNADAVLFHPTSDLSQYVSSAKVKMACPDSIVDLKFVNEEVKFGLEVRHSLGLDDVPTIGVIGPFHWYNRPAVEYVKANLRRFPEDVVFVMIGAIEEFARFSHPRVRFLGHVPFFYRYLSSVDCVMIPRFVTFGAPMNKMVSAMAAGVPVVTNNTEGMEVEDGVHCQVCSLEEMPERTSSLLLSKDLRTALASNAKSLVELRYSFDTVASNISNFLARID